MAVAIRICVSVMVPVILERANENHISIVSNGLLLLLFCISYCLSIVSTIRSKGRKRERRPLPAVESDDGYVNEMNSRNFFLRCGQT